MGMRNHRCLRREGKWMLAGLFLLASGTVQTKEISIQLQVNPPVITCRGFQISGTIDADGPVVEGGCRHGYSVYVIADIKKHDGSRYPLLATGHIIRTPPKAETHLTPGSGPGGTMTQIEAEGMDIDSLHLWSGGLCKECEFTAHIPFEFQQKTLRIRGFLKHQQNCVNAAYLFINFFNDVAWEGRLPEVKPEDIPSPHEVVIESGPAGTPNPVKSAQKVRCEIRARCSRGHDLRYQWAAGDGEFDRTDGPQVTWTAPDNCTGQEKTFRIACRVFCAQDGSIQQTGFYQQTVAPHQGMSLEEILEKYQTFGTTAHTWPDGTVEARPLVGKVGSGAYNNFLASARYFGRKITKEKNPYTRYECDAMQYKVMCGFLKKLQKAGLLECWEFRAVEGVSPPYPVHHAVVLWQKGTDWKRKGIILDPHGNQRPHYYSTETSVFDWHLEVTRDGRYHYVDPCALEPPWVEQGGSEKKASLKGFAVMCPVDVLIVNSRQQRLGIGPEGKYLQEFPPVDRYFWTDPEQDRQWYFALPDDDYSVTVTATGSGRVKLITTPDGIEFHDYGEYPVETGQVLSLEMTGADDRLILPDGRQPGYRVLDPAVFFPEKTEASHQPAGRSDSNPVTPSRSLPRIPMAVGISLLLIVVPGILLKKARPKRNRNR